MLLTEINDFQEMEDEEDDALLRATTDAAECQLTYQQQIGGSVNAVKPGRFEFKLNPYVDRKSTSHGVGE